MALAVLCHPPLASRLPEPMRKLLAPVAALGRGRTNGYGGISHEEIGEGAEGAAGEEDDVADAPRRTGGPTRLAADDDDDPFDARAAPGAQSL